MRDNLGDVDLEEIPYFSFVKVRDRIDYPRTVWTNLPAALRFPISVSRIARRLKRRSVQALVSDYDPFCSYAADRLNMPILQINHPAVVLRQREFSLESWLARVVSLVLMGKYHRKLVVSFYNGDVGPLVRRAITRQPVRTEDFFVVYLKPGYRKVMVRALRRLAIHNVQVFPDPRKNIVDYLGRCRGVISSAGHQFMSEAIVLGKPVFVVPQTGQYEQMLNARMLEESGRGMWARMDDLDEKLREFVSSVDRYPQPPRIRGVRFRFSDDLPRAVAQIERFLQEAHTTAYQPRRPMDRIFRWPAASGVTAGAGLSA